MAVVRDLALTADGSRKVVVVILPDTGRNYLSKLYNDEWMRSNGLLATTGPWVRIADLLRDRHHQGDRPDVVVARTTERVGEVIGRFGEHGISQMPVSEAAEGDDPASIVGSVEERSLLDRAYRDRGVVGRTVGEVMGRPLPIVDADASVDDAYGLLAGGASAVLAVRSGRLAGVVTRLDLLEHLAHHARD
jgi:cystathionine beta-synthase